jgi:type IV pilus assembly protein PilV
MKKPDIKMMKDKQRGSFVLEALIAILLFAIGILAIIGLQSASIRNTAGAKYRTDASLLANQIIGQMWAADKTNTTLVADFCGPLPGGNCAPATTSLYPAWANTVSQTLPGVTAGATNAPTISITANNVATITVFWQAPNDIAAHSYSTVANIND